MPTLTITIGLNLEKNSKREVKKLKINFITFRIILQ